jgi:acyl transferase domain-containing protein/acyl-CoA synthetase (AMP-forming)/AMP-acid ligase II/acyl carrier protein/SAM-dependent methyltransferase
MHSENAMELIAEAMNAADLLRIRASLHPGRLAFTFLKDGEREGIHLTYGELARWARVVSGRLQAEYDAGTRILLPLGTGLEPIAAFLGCLDAGMIAVPVPPRANRPSRRFETSGEDCQAAAVLLTSPAEAETGSAVWRSTSGPPIRQIVVESWNDARTEGAGQGISSANELAYLQYTSGSTGRPRGVMIGHANLLSNLRAIHHRSALTSGGRAVSWLPLYHDMGLLSLLYSIYAGFPCVLMSPVHFLQRPWRWLAAISEHRATFSGGPNFALELCARAVEEGPSGDLDLSCWAIAYSGSEPIRSASLDRFTRALAPFGFQPTALRACYGLAEATSLVTSGDARRLVVDSDRLRDGRVVKTSDAVHGESQGNGHPVRTVSLVSCGSPAEGHRIAIIDPRSGVPVGDNEVGEIWASGPSLAMGYWERPEESRSTFGALLPDGDGPFLRTGDLGFIEQGELFVVGRMKDLIIIRGVNYYPHDLELTVARSHEAFQSDATAAFAVEGSNGEELVVVQELQRLRTGASSTELHVMLETIRTSLGVDHGIRPAAIVLVGPRGVPRTSSGKVRRRACREAYLDGQLGGILGHWREANSKPSSETLTDGPRTEEDRGPGHSAREIESWLARRVATRVGIEPERIDRSESLAKLGLSSLEMVEVIDELGRGLGRSLPPTLAWDYSSLATLADYLAGGDADSVVAASRPRPGLAEPIAIIGLACRFPGAATPEEYWELLRRGRNAITRVSGERWHESEPPAICWLGALERIDEFDAEFFGITPREAQSMDPQQRLLLEVGWEALERAGIAPRSAGGHRTGVFVGIGGTDYSTLILHQPDHLARLGLYSGTGNAHSIAANRVSHTLDLHGPSLAVDSACSSSLVAIHLACQSLRQGECDLALAGGVNAILSPELSIAFARAGMLTSTGRCRPFEASADGYVRGEGCGLVVLKRLDDARRDGDPILAVIRGSAVNHDGRTQGLTAPSSVAQKSVIREALAMADMAADRIGYVEAHGTGTPLGDPIEFHALAAVLGRGPDQPACAFGSVKANIGHLETAAGVAGLIKVVLSLLHGEIPGQPDFGLLNPRIDLSTSGLSLATSHHPWPRTVSPRAAGVSSFGFGGTNAHIVLEESSEPVAMTGPDVDRNTYGYSAVRPRQLVTLSAGDDETLDEQARRLAGHLRIHPELKPADIAFSANAGRSPSKVRLAIVGTTTSEFADRLDAVLRGESPTGVHRGRAATHSRPGLAFLFTGQGSQHVGMGAQLFETQPVFRAALLRCAELLGPELDRPLLSVLFADGAARDANNPPRLDSTIYAQPALFALGYAIAELWKSWGIEPTAVLGHSLGELTAACVAGGLTLEDGLRLVAARGRLMQALPSDGGMAVVFTPKEKALAAIAPWADQLAIAAINGPGQVVLSGRQEALEAALRRLGTTSHRLVVSHAFHSPLVEPMLAEFQRLAAGIAPAPLRLPLISGMTGKVINAGGTLDAGYWARHARQTVQFADAVQTAAERGCRAFLEIGPSPTLLALGRLCLPDAGTWLPSLKPGHDEWATMLDSLGALFVLGLGVNWEGYERGYSRPRKVALPTYPFRRRRFWFADEPAPRLGPAEEGPTPVKTDLNSWTCLGPRLPLPLSSEVRFPARLEPGRPHFLEDHVLLGARIAPAAAFLVMSAKAAGLVQDLSGRPLGDIVFPEPLILVDGGRELQVIVSTETSKVEVVGLDSGVTHARGTLLSGSAETRRILVAEEAEAIRDRCPVAIAGEAFYRDYALAGYTLGPRFRWVEHMWLGHCESLCRLRTPAELSASGLDLHRPVEDAEHEVTMIDAAFQAIAALVGTRHVVAHDGSDPERSPLYVPFALGRFDWRGPYLTQLWCHARIVEGVTADPSAVVGAACLFDDNGHIIAELQGLHIRPIPRQILETAARSTHTTSNHSRDIGNWFYQLVWRESALLQSPDFPSSDQPPGNWLILADPTGLGDALAAWLRQHNQYCKIIEPTTASAAGTLPGLNGVRSAIDPTRREHFDRLLNGDWPGDVPPRGVVHLWGLGTTMTGSGDDVAGACLDREIEGLTADQAMATAGAFHLAQAVSSSPRLKPTRLWLITRSAQKVALPHARATESVAVSQTPLWGLGRVVGLEMPQLECTCLDLEADGVIAAQVAALGNELLTPGHETQIAHRRGRRYVARLLPVTSAACDPAISTASLQRPYRLVTSGTGVLDDLFLEPYPAEPPQPGHVTIRAHAAGLNFRDVLSALGLYPGEAGPLGGECTGVIHAVGEGVEGLSVGDDVVALAPGSFASEVYADAALVLRRPQGLNDQEAATLPVAFLTAMIALERLGRLSSGEHVLIHAAAGGVGHAAIQVAQRLGAVVFATASRTKWDALRAMGVRHVLDSRSLAFAEVLPRMTDGRGVDVVLNCLTDPYIEAGLSVLAPGGRFIEIGKRGIWDLEQVARLRPDVSYHTLALDRMVIEDRTTVSATLAEVLRRIEAGEFRSLPYRDFPIGEALAAFRLVQQSRHVGKVVLTFPTGRPGSSMIQPEGTYLIAGGLGGLGIEAAGWLIGKGARHLALLGRSGATESTRDRIEAWRATGVEIESLEVDITKAIDMERTLAGIRAAMPPLRGVIHAAGALDDSALDRLDWGRFEAVLAPKIQGAWNLHRLTRRDPLDIFVLFSSAASLLGSPGQANYAAANAFLDGLAHHRLALGLPALSINWGPWSDVGMASRRATSSLHWSRTGLELISPARGREALARALDLGLPQVAIIASNPSWPASFTTTGRSPVLDELVGRPRGHGDEKGTESPSVRAKLLKQVPPERRREALAEYLQEAIASILRLAPNERPDRTTGFFEIGMDSLMAVELRNRLMADLQPAEPLPSTLSFNYPTIDDLAGHLAGVLADQRPSPDAVPGPSEHIPSPPGVAEHGVDAPIAIVGGGCRFPGDVDSLESFWTLLCEGRDAITRVPPGRWDADALYNPDPESAGTIVTRSGGFVAGLDRFDAEFFGISPREAASLDPQQRMVLEVAWEALEHAGIPPRRLEGSATGVFVGIAISDYYQTLVARGLSQIDAYTATGNAHSMAAGRLSHMLGLRGPSLAIDTACSSSLVAVHAACQSLRNSECDLALAGGVNALLSPAPTVFFSRARMLSPSGRCMTFDASADGYVRGEGCGLVVLKRLDDARRDGDTILAVIRGSAVNHDGRSSGLTVPNGLSQQAVITRALARAGVSGADVGYVETHGTGTPLGDPIEAFALDSALRSGDDGAEDLPVYIGSVKTNFGHLEAAAGAAGLIKTALAVHHGLIPPHLHLTRPSPQIPWDRLRLRVATEMNQWPPENRPRTAGVSAFSFCGTNVHVILQQSPTQSDHDGGDKPGRVGGRPLHMLCLSARTKEALAESCRRLRDHLGDHPEIDIADVSHTLNACRSHFDCRRALIAGSVPEAIHALAELEHSLQKSAQSPTPPTTEKRPRLAVLFAGQSGQLNRLGRDLCRIEPLFREAVECCARTFGGEFGTAVRREFGLDPQASGEPDQPMFVSVLWFTTQYAHWKLWRSWGVIPDALIAQGEGDAAAACAAGILSIEEAARLVVERGRRLEGLDGPRARGAFGRSALAAGVEIRPQWPLFLASGDGQLLADPTLLDTWLAPDFPSQSEGLEPTLRTLRAQGYDLFLEIGPGPEADRDAPAASDSGRDGWTAVLNNLCALYCGGCRIDWDEFGRGHYSRRIDLPTYPFQRSRHWIDAPPEPSTCVAIPKEDAIPRLGDLPWPGRRLRAAIQHTLFESILEAHRPPLLDEHMVHGVCLIAGSWQILLMAAAARAALPGVTAGQALVIEEVRFLTPLAVEDGHRRPVQVIALPEGDRVKVEIHVAASEDVDPTWTKHAAARVRPCGSIDDPGPLRRIHSEGVETRFPDVIEAAWFYDGLASCGIALGPGFRWIERAWRREGEALCRLRPARPGEGDAFGSWLPPGLLDAGVQALGVTLAHRGIDGAAMLPYAASTIRFHIDVTRAAREASAPLWCHARLCRDSADRAEGDIEVFDEAGQLLWSIEGLQLKQVSRAAFATDATDPWRNWLYRLTWIPVGLPMPTGPPDFLASPVAIASRLTPETDQPYDGPRERSTARAELDAICAGFAFEALRDMGWPGDGQPLHADGLADQLGVAATRRRLFERLLGMLEEDGLLTRERRSDSSSNLVLKAYQAGEVSASDRLVELGAYWTLSRGNPLTALLGRCGPRLAEILRGELDPLTLLFPAGSQADIEALYRDSPLAGAANELVARAIATAIEGRPAGRTLRILELGGGTGGTTAHVLPKLPAGETTYHFTDVSPLFLGRAAETFAKSPFVRYRTLDLEREPEDQGMSPDTFDLILAAHVLHATTDLERTLDRVLRLLAPGGLLVILETTTPLRWLDLVFGLTDGWWRFTDYELRPAHPLLSRSKWQEVLRNRGFLDVVALDGEGSQGDDSPLTAFLARRPESGLAGGLSTDGGWLILTDSFGVGEALGGRLAASGEQVHLAQTRRPPDWPEPNGTRLEIESVGSPNLLRMVDHRGGPLPLRGVVGLWGLDAANEVDPAPAASRIAEESLRIIKALAEERGELPPRLYLVTRGAQSVGAEAWADPAALAQSPLWGLGKVVSLEHADCRCVLIDLESERAELTGTACPEVEKDAQLLEKEIWADDRENLIAYRNGVRYVARLDQVNADEGLKSVRLDSTGRGLLDNLTYRPTRRTRPGPGEVEVRVKAAGLNFLDVMDALGVLPTGRDWYGAECAGEVTAVGAGDCGFFVGQEVVALAPGSIATWATTSTSLVVPRPGFLSVEQAAALPVAYLTAWYALHDVARLAHGERVLIHAATGGVGLAAVHVARRLGAEVHATASSPQKHQFLRELGVASVSDSRSLSFVEAILERTGGRGVDVVLNSLAGEFIRNGLSVLRRNGGGRFLEIGKTGIWDSGQVAQVRDDVAYHVIALDRLVADDPARVGALLREVMEKVSDGLLPPLPVHAFSSTEVVAAFRHMSQARHIGKIVITSPNTEPPGRRPASIRPDGSYLITGGLGDLGLCVARWLIGRGARHLALLGRREPTPEQAAVVEELRRAGARVLLLRADLSRRDEVDAALDTFDRTLPPPRGVVHAAGLLDDGVLLQQTAARLRAVLAPKVDGAWALHEWTRNRPLDWFVMFSSAVALWGSPGQASHAAACSFIDRLASYRRAQGLPALSINWGPWSETGAAARREAPRAFARQGLGGIPTAMGLSALEWLLDSDSTQAAVIAVDWSTVRRQFPAGNSPPLLNLLLGPTLTDDRIDPAVAHRHDFLDHFHAALPGERRRRMIDYLSTQAARVLGLAKPGAIDPRRPLHDLGLDSLMAIELRNALVNATGVHLPASLLFDCPTLESLADFLVLEVFGGDAPVSRPDVCDINGLDGLSDGELSALLDEELKLVHDRLGSTAGREGANDD